MKRFNQLNEELIDEGLKDSFNKIKKMFDRFQAAKNSLDPDSLNDLIKQAEWHLKLSKSKDKKKLAFYVKKLKNLDVSKDKDRVIVGRIQDKFMSALKNVSS